MAVIRFHGVEGVILEDGFDLFSIQYMIFFIRMFNFFDSKIYASIFSAMTLIKKAANNHQGTRLVAGNKKGVLVCKQYIQYRDLSEKQKSFAQT
jgi:hypothetical protein